MAGFRACAKPLPTVWKLEWTAAHCIKNEMLKWQTASYSEARVASICSYLCTSGHILQASLLSTSKNVSAVLWVSNGATVTLEDITITQNTIFNQFNNSTLIGVSAVEQSKVNAQHQDTILRLQNDTLTSKSGPRCMITDL